MAACTKRYYPDQVSARIDMKRIRKRMGSDEESPKRAYPCNSCGGWHLTSQRRPAKPPWWLKRK